MSFRKLTIQLLIVSFFSVFIGLNCSAQQIKDNDSIQIGETLEINVFQEKDLTGKYKVDKNGNIMFPLTGEIKLGGLQLDQAKEEMIKRLKQFILNPQISIISNQRNNASLTLFGQVSKPGSYEVAPGLTLTQLIASSGELKPDADVSNIRILRKSQNGDESIAVNLSEIFNGKTPDLPLKSGDIINFPAKNQGGSSDRITVLGGVKSPGIYPSYSGMTLLQLIAVAGDLSVDGDSSQVHIIRANKSGTKEILNIDLDMIIAGLENDIVVQPSDVVTIFKGGFDNHITLIGQVRKPGVYDYKIGTTLLSLIATAGDFTEMANKGRIKIVRHRGRKIKVLNVNIQRILQGKTPDVFLEPNDIINVSEALF